MKSSPPSVLPLLRSETQGRLLDALLAEPGREWTLRELADQLGVSPATVMREVDRAEQAGIATSRRLGNTRLVAADSDSPLIEPLRQLLTPTFGVPRVLFEEFADIDGVEEVHVVGSWAAAWHGEPRAVGDLDVLVIAEHADRAALYDAADRAERRLGRPVDVIVRSPAQWHAEPAGDPWVAEVRQRPIVTVTRAATQAEGGRG